MDSVQGLIKFFEFACNFCFQFVVGITGDVRIARQVKFGICGGTEITDNT